MTYYNGINPNVPMVGLTCVSVEVTSDYADCVTLEFDTGPKVRFTLDGDCCSHSYFTPEGISAFKELIGSTIQSVEEVDNHDGLGESFYPSSSPESDSTSWHFLKFTTSKGHITVDWRNDSNGYYDGVLYINYQDPPKVTQ
jgi:hypothetical protein